MYNNIEKIDESFRVCVMAGCCVIKKKYPHISCGSSALCMYLPFLRIIYAYSTQYIYTLCVCGLYRVVVVVVVVKEGDMRLEILSKFKDHDCVRKCLVLMHMCKIEVRTTYLNVLTSYVIFNPHSYSHLFNKIDIHTHIYAKV